MGFFSSTTTPQIPPPHLLTRTLASPACVSQIPLTSPPACARAGEAPTIANAATRSPQAASPKAENLIMNLETAIWGVMLWEFRNRADVLSNKANLCNGPEDVGHQGRPQ